MRTPVLGFLRQPNLRVERVCAPLFRFDTFFYDGKPRIIQWDWILLDRKVGRNEGVGAQIFIYDPGASGDISWTPVCEFDFRE